MKIFLEAIYTIFGVVAIIAVLFVLVGGAIHPLLKWKCEKQTAVMEKEYKFIFPGGCMVKTDQGFVHMQQYRVTD